MKRDDDPQLSPDEVLKSVTNRLRQLSELSMLERYAMFMGKAQIVEMALKKLLHEKYEVSDQKTEKFTLGQTINKLEKEGLRKDFLILLRQLNKYRNDMAHNFLLDDSLGKNLIGSDFQHLSEKTLRYALFKVEEVILVYDFLMENNYL